MDKSVKIRLYEKFIYLINYYRDIILINLDFLLTLTLSQGAVTTFHLPCLVTK